MPPPLPPEASGNGRDQPCLPAKQRSWATLSSPAVSLLDPEVYSIPVLFLVGWRGGPGTRDEPQHIKQGRITFALLDVLGIRNALLPAERPKPPPCFPEAFAYMKKEQAPFALVAAPGTFAPYKLQNKVQTNYPLRREGSHRNSLWTVSVPEMSLFPPPAKPHVNYTNIAWQGAILRKGIF